MVDLVVNALVWNIWLARNNRIFNANILPVHSIILIIDHILLSWFDVLANGAKAKLEDPISTIRRSLEFLRPTTELSRGVPTAKEAHDLTTG